MAKKVTIVDIAAKIGVTPSAVSKAFSDHPRISPETKQAVLRAAKEMGYRPNVLATGLRKGKSGLIGVVVPAVHYSFFSNAIKGIEELVSTAGFNLVITQSHDNYENETRNINALLRARVEGMIASLAGETTDYSAYRDAARDIPVVLFDRTFTDENISEVTIDDFGGAVAAVQHLVDMGYKRIAHLSGYKNILPFAKRIEGYKHVLMKHRLYMDDDYICECMPNRQEGQAAMERLLSHRQPPDAIFAASDVLAYGAMLALQKRGIRVPQDFGVIGFSNEELSSIVTPSMSTVDQHSEILGAMAAKVLIDQLHIENRDNAFRPVRKIINSDLIIRDSSRRLASASTSKK
jgi:LacI family transcriptional regulator